MTCELIPQTMLLSKSGKPRRPRIDEMDKLTTREVRDQIEVGSSQASLSRTWGSLVLDLIWLERTAGIFGPGSAAYARQLRLDVKKPPERACLEKMRDVADRGKRSAWLLYFACPRCSRRCRVLYSLKGVNEFGCIKCNRPAYPSNCWPYTGRRNAKGISRSGREMLKHKSAAARISRKLAATRRGEDSGALMIAKEIHEQHALLLGIKMALSSVAKVGRR